MMIVQPVWDFKIKFSQLTFSSNTQEFLDESTGTFKVCRKIENSKWKISLKYALYGWKISKTLKNIPTF